MSIFSTNKKKKQPNQEELISFLSLSSFNSKQEEEISYKFGHLTGNGTYFIFNNHNKTTIIATINDEQCKYNYLRKQENNINAPIVYYKIQDNIEPLSIWNDPNNQWRYGLIFKDGVWREPKINTISPEDNGISIIEAVVTSKYKASIKKNIEPDFEEKDWEYAYFGGNQWNIWAPTKERLLKYCEEYNKEEFKTIIKQYKC